MTTATERRPAPEGSPPGVPSLTTQDLSVHFAGVKALDGIDLRLERGEILGLIGPNGAGKTTLVNALSGFQRPTRGRVYLDGHDITGLSSFKLARLGMVRTFQSVRLFPRLTVLENVVTYAVARGLSKRAAAAMSLELLHQLDLGDRAHDLARGLPHGIERRIGIARALAGSPSFLLLDEPAAGLNEAESDAMVVSLNEISRQRQCGLMIIEHDMRLIMQLCHRIQVLDFGQTIAVGEPAAIQADPVVVAAYLGVDEED